MPPTGEKCSTKLLPRYKVTYDANGGEGTMAKTTNKVVANEFTRNKYEFVEWNTKIDGSGETYTTESEVKSNIRLFAIWKRVYRIGDNVNYNPNTNQPCSSPTGIKDGCMKFYVIKDNDLSIDAILDHNTTAYVAYEPGGQYKEYAQSSIKTQVDTDATGWASGLNPRLITANEIATITNTTTFNGSSSTWFYFDGIGTNKQTRVSNSQGSSPYAWLFDYTNGCTSYGCNIADNSNDGYCSSSSVTDDSYRVWRVGSDGSLGNANVYSYYGCGIRPVITIQKSVFE